MLLPAFVALFGVIAAVFLWWVRSDAAGQGGARSGARRGVHEFDDFRTEVIPVLRDSPYDSPYRREFASQPDMFRRDKQGDWYVDDDFVDDDDDDYVEFTVDRDVRSAGASALRRVCRAPMTTSRRRRPIGTG